MTFKPRCARCEGKIEPGSRPRRCSWCDERLCVACWFTWGNCGEPLAPKKEVEHGSAETDHG